MSGPVPGIDLTQRFAAQMGQLLGPEFPDKIALAVSGGGDSMAMLALSHGWARVYGTALHVVTVDHGLRADSCEEATQVAEECAALGHPHTTLRWHWDGTGNLQDAARRARLSLINAWRGDIDHVLFAHTQDDLAETFLMRLARGAGVEGLSAMAATRLSGPGGFQIVRPLLDASRAELRHYIDTLKVPYVNDPSNEDPRFDRVRARAALRDLGIEAETLSATATRLSRAAEALRARAAQVADDVVRADATGALRFDRDGFAAIEPDTQLRLLARALCWVSSTVYRPRASALEGLLDRVLAGGGGTLHGAEVVVEGGAFWVVREVNPLRDAPPHPDGALWDGRWQVLGQVVGTYSVRALGPEGWSHLPAPAREGLSYRLNLSVPALWDGDRLVGFAPAKFGVDHSLIFNPSMGTFAAFLVSR